MYIYISRCAALKHDSVTASDYRPTARCCWRLAFAFVLCLYHRALQLCELRKLTSARCMRCNSSVHSTAEEWNMAAARTEKSIASWYGSSILECDRIILLPMRPALGCTLSPFSGFVTGPVDPALSHLLTSWSGGSVAEWLACWTQAQKGLGSNSSRDAVE